MGHGNDETNDKMAEKEHQFEPIMQLVDLARVLAREAARKDVAALHSPDTASERGDRDD